MFSLTCRKIAIASTMFKLVLLKWKLKLKITCACHQARIEICCQTPLIPLIAPKMGFFSTCGIQICRQIWFLTTPGIYALTKATTKNSYILTLLLMVSLPERESVRFDTGSRAALSPASVSR